MPNKIVVVIETPDYPISERDVAEALKSHFPNMLTKVREIKKQQSAKPPYPCDCFVDYGVDENGLCRMCGGKTRTES